MEVAASIIAVLQLSEAVLRSCYRYTEKVKEATDDIDRLTHRIGYLSTLLGDLQSITGSGGTTMGDAIGKLGGEHGPLSICAQCLEELNAKLPSGPVKLRQKLQWPFESKKIKEITERIAGQVPVIELALSSESYKKVVDAKQREERDKVLNWLRSADPTIKHLAARRLHQPGSNQWVLDNADFLEWRDKPGQTLWLHGIPGAGKTGTGRPLPLCAL